MPYEKRFNPKDIEDKNWRDFFEYLFGVVDDDDDEEDDDEDETDVTDDDIPFCDDDCTECPGNHCCEDEEVVCEDDEGFPSMWGVPDIDRVTFNPPATIIFWEDGTKTVVKCAEGQLFERYAGFSASVMKKLFGSTANAKDVMEQCDVDNWKRAMEEEKERLRQQEAEKHEAKAKADAKRKVTVDDLTDLFNKFGALLESLKISAKDDEE